MHSLGVSEQERHKYSKEVYFKECCLSGNLTFPSFWCCSKAEMSSFAHWTLSGWGENSSCTAWTCPGWITCFPLQKQQNTQTHQTHRTVCGSRSVHLNTLVQKIDVPGSGAFMTAYDGQQGTTLSLKECLGQGGSALKQTSAACLLVYFVLCYQ